MSRLTERISFGRIPERGEMPHFLQYQLNSYEEFLQYEKKPTEREYKGLQRIFKDTFPIESSSGDLNLEYLWYELEENDFPLNEELECKKRGKTFSVSLKVKLRLINNKTGEMQDSLVYFGEIPRMTDKATFIINGAERVVVSQLHRSPGVSFNKDVNVQTFFSTSKSLLPFFLIIIPPRG